jgi:hypothetical protein
VCTDVSENGTALIFHLALLSVLLLLEAYLAYYLTLKNEQALSSTVPTNMYQTTRRHIPDGDTLRGHRRDSPVAC